MLTESVKVTFEMEEQQVDSIIIQDIKRNLKEFEEDLELRADGKGLAIFHEDPVKDVAQISQYISAFELILDYYGGSSN
jgi:DNA topoisomerase VI subunit A